MVTDILLVKSRWLSKLPHNGEPGTMLTVVGEFATWAGALGEIEDVDLAFFPYWRVLNTPDHAAMFVMADRPHKTPVPEGVTDGV